LNSISIFNPVNGKEKRETDRHGNCAVAMLLNVAVYLARTGNAAFHSLFPPAAHPDMSKTHDGRLQNFASRKGGKKLYMTINTKRDKENIYMTINIDLHMNPCPAIVKAYEKKVE
jgi:hypothetical protein